MTEISRGSTYERAGDWVAADRAYAEVYSAALSRGDVPAVVEALRKMANARFRHAAEEEAAELAELSAEIALRSGLAAAAARAWNVLAVIRHSSGSLEIAESLYEAALEPAREADDPETVGAVCQNLGVIANIRGDCRGARLLYLEAIASFVRSGNRLAAMAAYNNLGMVCTDLEEWMEAEVYFARGIEIARQLGDFTMLAKLHSNRAEPLIRIGDFGAARRSLDAAEEFAGHSGYGRAAADLNRFRAMIERLEGDCATAESYLDRSLDVCSGDEMTLQRGEALEELARIRLAQQRAGAARVLLRESMELYRSIGAHRDVSRLQELSEETLRRPPEAATV
ncbi:MAG: hypothetical protein WD766_04060 [Gemmatimonadota bacterium]